MKNTRFRKVIDRFKAGLAEAKPPEPKTGTDERFVMKPGEVTILRGGGAKIDRQPGEPRDAG